MNGYKLIADSYRNVAQGADKEIREGIEKKIRIYDFLATCDQEDKCELFNSSAFNDFVKMYCQLAMNEAELDQDEQDKVMSNLKYLMDSVDVERVADQLSGIVCF